eukprot:2719360-Amphidinium_carterae.1
MLADATRHRSPISTSTRHDHQQLGRDGHTPDGQLRTFTAAEKELHDGRPRHHTLHDLVHDTALHRIIANGWHLGVAKFVLAVVMGQVLGIALVGASPAVAVPAVALLAIAGHPSTIPDSLDPWIGLSAPGSSSWRIIASSLKTFPTPRLRCSTLASADSG